MLIMLTATEAKKFSHEYHKKRIFVKGFKDIVDPS